jgi:2-dehydropantoate 2-reductase
MRILVVGAGGIGGYVGGRLLAAGRAVTFLVRPARERKLKEAGLVIRSPAGNLEWPSPPTVTAKGIDTHFDLVILSCKAFDLDSAIEALAPAVGRDTLILPLLNGMRHIDVLEARFGAQAVLGGQCVISTNLDKKGRILHFGELQNLSFGSLDGFVSPRIEAIAGVLSVAGIDVARSTEIIQEMWEKWVFITTGACCTCLMGSTIGDIVAAGATNVVTTLLDECSEIAEGEGRAPRPDARKGVREMLTTPGSSFTASMFRNIQAGVRIEADHIVGDLLARGTDSSTPTLRIAFAHLKTYERRRERELAKAVAAFGNVEPTAVVRARSLSA